MFHLQINHHEKELNYFDRAIYNSIINYCWFLRNLHIFAFCYFLLEKGVSYNYTSPERKFHEELKYAVELLIGSKGEWDMDLAKILFCGPQNPNIVSHKILVPDPISYWMPYLNSSWKFLSENGRAKISQDKLSWSSRGAQFSESGDVTLRVASSKRMAILESEKKEIYLLGDLNINLLNYDSHEKTKEFSDMMYSFNIYPLIAKPTRISANRASLIDNIYTNTFEEEKRFIMESSMIIFLITFQYLLS